MLKIGLFCPNQSVDNVSTVTEATVQQKSADLRVVIFVTFLALTQEDDMTFLKKNATDFNQSLFTGLGAHLKKVICILWLQRELHKV